MKRNSDEDRDEARTGDRTSRPPKPGPEDERGLRQWHVGRLADDLPTLMPGWFATNADFDHGFYLDHSGGARIFVRVDGYGLRRSGDSRWRGEASYSTRNTMAERFSAASMDNSGPMFPDKVTFDLSRPVAAIAKDIVRKLSNQLVVEHAKWVVELEAREAGADRAMASAQRLAAILKTSNVVTQRHASSPPRVYARGGPGREVSFEAKVATTSGLVDLEIKDIPADLAERIARLVAEACPLEDD